MNYTISGRGITVSDRLKGVIEARLDKLSKHFADDTEARVTLLKEGDMAKIEVTIPTKLGLIRAEDASQDLDAAIDSVGDIIEKQIKKFKNKLIDKKHSAAPFSQAFVETVYPEYVDDDEIKIVKNKKFELIPMDPEEACLGLEMTGHSFYVFLNADTGKVNVVYKRKGNTYGLIECE